MTEQEIAKLVFNAGSLGEFPKLQRLLEERRRLLEALNAAAEERGDDVQSRKVSEQIEAAIVFAEEPAP